MVIQPVVDYFARYLPLDPKEIEELRARLVSRTIKRRQFILAEGEVCKHYTFIVEGCVKMYRVDEAGKEHNLLFAAENEWIADIGSFHAEKASKLYIEAMEPARIFQLAKADLIYFFEENIKFNRIFRVVVENELVQLQDRLLQTISHSAEDRYEQFLLAYPHLGQRLPNAQIASYLGITPEFLSRIRRARMNP